MNCTAKRQQSDGEKEGQKRENRNAMQRHSVDRDDVEGIDKNVESRM